MRRRDFIGAVAGSTAMWSLGAHAQRPAMQVIGFLGSASPDKYTIRLNAFRQGLKDTGYVDGQNVLVEYRWAHGLNDRLPALAAELVQRHVAVLVAGGGTPSALAAKAATSTIPIVFELSPDPVALGLVASLNRPGGNITGVTNLNIETGPKRLELLRQMLPAATKVAVIINPTSQALAKTFLQTLRPAASTLGLQLHILEASTEAEIDQGFAALGQLKADAVVIQPDVFFTSRDEQFGALAVRYAVPTISMYRPFVAAGGLVSYGPSEWDNYRLVGHYVGKILKGEKATDLPVQRSTKVELIINLKTAKALGITVPLDLSGRADELIE
jgi:putative tryptophan/tyrosine transport system substrate-binding protein